MIYILLICGGVNIRIMILRQTLHKYQRRIVNENSELFLWCLAGILIAPIGERIFQCLVCYHIKDLKVEMPKL